ncbi:MAG: response regulator [Bdellovibrionales bacterium]|nr:response regulator [Bdellovibrionales bacterium]
MSVTTWEEKPRILAVDDRPENLLAIHAVLDSPDYTITDCTSGVEALKKVMDGNYDLILLDVRMPEMDGFQTAQLIRSRPRSELTPLIFITAGDGNEESAMKGYNVGAVDFLVKPFPAEALKKKVEFFIKFGPKIRTEQHQRDISTVYKKFEKIFYELINPLWFILLNIQILKKISNKDKEKFMLAISKKLGSLETATHQLRDLLINYKVELEEETKN